MLNTKTYIKAWMKYGRFSIISLFYILLSVSSSGTRLVAQVQTVFSFDPYAFRKHALAVGASLNTQGMGIDVLQIRRLEKNNEVFILYQLASLVDSREQAIRNDNLYESAKYFVFDKKNYCYTLGGVIGLQRIINPLDNFSRFSIRVGVGMGPVIALLKPYYVDYFLPSPTNPNFGTAVPRQYDHTQMNFTDIIGASDFFKGFEKLSFSLGLRFRPNIILNFANSNLYIRAIQIGAQLDIYSNAIEILDESEDYSVFLQGSIGFLIGNCW
ncbi:MAG: hypothetical protein RML72_06845 [Bacteroidia bacterium]|nr:hypothetical protein [Bacteroidia bacterium]MDW8158577.1 hypothetical protein [Bacteroidia bacterium]